MPEGSCLCGDIRYRVGDDYQFVAHCHCSMCRKSHGSAFATYVGVQGSEFHWLSGREKVVSYQSSPDNHRGFCPRCGSVAPMVDDERAAVYVPAGNLDDEFQHRSQAHIFVTSKAAWYEIPDELPRFDAYPPELNLPVIDIAPRVAETEGAIAGSCQCGTVRFELSGEPLWFGNCHCSRCRRGRSAAHASNFFVTPEQIRWLGGEDNTSIYEPADARFFGIRFCNTCGSGVPRVLAELGRVNVPAGSLDTDPGVSPMAHIYVGSKAPWFEIEDDLPQHDEGLG
jgi:hypothetical protein